MTTMATSIPNVKDTCFPHQVLTRIHGIPVYETLKVLTTEITDNAAAVPTSQPPSVAATTAISAW